MLAREIQPNLLPTIAYNANLNPNKELVCRSGLNHINTSQFNSSQNVNKSRIDINHEAQMFPSMPSSIQNISILVKLVVRIQES